MWIISFLLLVCLLLAFLFLSHLCFQHLALISAHNPHCFFSPAVLSSWQVSGLGNPGKALSWGAPFLLMDITTGIWSYRKKGNSTSLLCPLLPYMQRLLIILRWSLCFLVGFSLEEDCGKACTLELSCASADLSINGFCREGDAEWGISELSGLRDVWMPAHLFLSIMGYNSGQVWYQRLFLLEKVRIKSRRLMEHKMLVYIPDRAVCVALHVWSTCRYTSPSDLHYLGQAFAVPCWWTRRK